MADERRTESARDAEIRHMARNEMQQVFVEQEGRLAEICRKAVRDAVPEMFDVDADQWRSYRGRIRDSVEAYERRSEVSGSMIERIRNKALDVVVSAVVTGGIAYLILNVSHGGHP